MDRMSVKEFREIGILQELNRRFLHPMGLALEVVVDDDMGIERFGAVWQTDDPEGFVFDEGQLDKDKMLRVCERAQKMRDCRARKLGFIVQQL